MNNQELQSKYNEMHAKGATAWFSDGREERETILKIGEPWDDKVVLEVGCGEGELGYLISGYTKGYIGVDYSKEAINKAHSKYPGIAFWNEDYRKGCQQADRIVMQGVLEHLDEPFTELKWMIDNLLVKGGDVITSSPCFLNPRGIVWMTLDMLGAVMSKTDLHYLHPWEFSEFVDKYKYDLHYKYCDWDWGNGVDMITDLGRRIPLALHDGNLKPKKSVLDFLDYLSKNPASGLGATCVYKIQT